MHASRANASAARRRWSKKPPKLGNYIGKEFANPRSPGSFGSAEPPSAASWPKRNLESAHLTQPCRKDTNERSRLRSMSGSNEVQKAIRELFTNLKAVCEQVCTGGSILIEFD